jgi:prepilin-type processing-associated H-X9-DG protein
MWRTRALVAHSYGNTKLLKDNWDPGHRGTNSRKIQEMGGTILLYENVGAGINGDYPVSPVAQMAIDTQRRRVVSWAGSGVGSFPVGHRPTFWWREGASAVIQDYASENIDYCSMRVSHRGKTTLLYADAHVELTRPYDPYIRLRDNGRLGSAYDVGNLWHGGTLYTPSDINTVWRDNVWWCR